MFRYLLVIREVNHSVRLGFKLTHYRVSLPLHFVK
jgi:hypothetical protein